MLSLFQRGQERPEWLPGERLQILERVNRLESQLRLLEVEQATVHDQVRKWMRRAVAAERIVGERTSENAGPEKASGGATPGAPSLNGTPTEAVQAFLTAVKGGGLRSVHLRRLVRRLQRSGALTVGSQDGSGPPGCTDETTGADSGGT